MNIHITDRMPSFIHHPSVTPINSKSLHIHKIPDNTGLYTQFTFTHFFVAKKLTHFRIDDFMHRMQNIYIRLSKKRFVFCKSVYTVALLELHLPTPRLEQKLCKNVVVSILNIVCPNINLTDVQILLKNEFSIIILIFCTCFKNVFSYSTYVHMYLQRCIKMTETCMQNKLLYCFGCRPCQEDHHCTILLKLIVKRSISVCISVCQKCQD